MENDFESVRRTLSDALDEVESKRLELRKKGCRNGLIVAAVLLGSATAVTLWSGSPAALIVGAVAALVAGPLTANAPSSELNRYYKRRIVARIVRAVCGEQATFDPADGIAEETFRACGLFDTRPDRYRSEDLVCGSSGQTPFRFAEVHAQERRTTTDSKGRTRTHWVDIFRGFLFLADFHKDFRGRTLVCRDSWFRLRFDDCRRVRLENPQFEQLFDVYSNDAVEARYLLSPSTMERLVRLDTRFRRGITASFHRSCIVIAIPDSTNHFEAGLWRSVRRTDRLEREFDTIRMLKGIVEDLDLNTRIWSKTAPAALPE
ncbi:DUF3137 domain-containing protein [uncultured Alistipes sp.]|uniref:DUF3137 domain-containing protein n=1 Tax=uncultured Alistipes sp. TaxID=538949 RepID=UPI00260759BF|nr:DUF3137 domain-containing protein [uncultured Alistipes sp.]